MESTLAAVLAVLKEDDPLGIQDFCRITWQAQLMARRRYSAIYLLQPDGNAGCVSARLGSPAVILKLYHAKQSERRQKEFDDLCTVYDAMSDDTGAGIVRPFACYPEWGAVLTARAPGVAGGELIRTACRKGAPSEMLARAAALCSQAGTWLHNFQQRGQRWVKTAHPGTLASPGDFQDYLEERLQILARHRLGLPVRECASLAAKARAILMGCDLEEPGHRTWAHSDFGPHNILLQGVPGTSEAPHITVLDFELQAQHLYFDAAYYLESIEAHEAPWNEGEGVRRLAQAFQVAWGEATDPALFEVFRLRHLLCSYVSQIRQSGTSKLRALPGIWNSRRRLRQLAKRLEIRQPKTTVAAGA